MLSRAQNMRKPVRGGGGRMEEEGDGVDYLKPVKFVSAKSCTPTAAGKMVHEAGGEREDQLKSVSKPGRYSGKGKAMMERMGWKVGTGLGRANQGILVPVGTELQRTVLGMVYEAETGTYVPKRYDEDEDEGMATWSELEVAWDDSEGGGLTPPLQHCWTTTSWWEFEVFWDLF